MPRGYKSLQRCTQAAHLLWRDRWQRGNALRHGPDSCLQSILADAQRLLILQNAAIWHHKHEAAVLLIVREVIRVALAKGAGAAFRVHV